MNQSVLVRPARPEDAKYVVGAHTMPHAVGNVHGPPSVESFLAVLANKDRKVAIIDAGGRPVGTFMFALSDPPWLVEFLVLVVTEPRRRFGTIAVQWVLNHAFRDLGAHRVSLEVVARNRIARRLYEAAGFLHEGTWRDGYRDDDGSFRDLCVCGCLEQDVRFGRVSAAST